MDLWSAKNRASYMCITVHYLVYERPDEKQDMVLKSSILAFHQLKGKHTGKNIADTVTKLLVRADIDPRQVCYCVLHYTDSSKLIYKSTGLILDSRQRKQ